MDEEPAGHVAHGRIAKAAELGLDCGPGAVGLELHGQVLDEPGPLPTDSCADAATQDGDGASRAVSLLVPPKHDPSLKSSPCGWLKSNSGMSWPCLPTCQISPSS